MPRRKFWGGTIKQSVCKRVGNNAHLAARKLKHVVWGILSIALQQISHPCGLCARVWGTNASSLQAVQDCFRNIKMALMPQLGSLMNKEENLEDVCVNHSWRVVGLGAGGLLAALMGMGVAVSNGMGKGDCEGIVGT